MFQTLIENEHKYFKIQCRRQILNIKLSGNYSFNKNFKLNNIFYIVSGICMLSMYGLYTMLY